MRSQQYLTRALRIVGLVALATVLSTWITWKAYDSSHSSAGIAEAGSTNVKSNHKRLTALQRLKRDEFWASRQGLQFGVPAHGLADAAAEMRSSELGMRTPSGSSQFADVFTEFSGQPSLASFAAAWTFIGPQPIQEKANFTGLVFGNDFAATGRITSVAADSTGLIVVGAASGGVWLSQNSGTTFSPVFDTGPTQAIGAVALDTTTTPSTIYIGTGEGNGSFDSLWGQGMFKSSNLGVTWTAVGPAGTFDHNSFTSIAIAPTKTIGTPIIFAGLTTGFSAGRTDPAIFESDQTLSGLWMSSNGGTSWTHYPASTFGGCEVIVSTNSPCPADDVKVDPTNPQNVYVAIDSFNVFYSHNGGTTWTQAAFPGGVLHQGRQGLAIGPPDAAGEPGIVYALIGAQDGLEYVGFFASVDGGVTWNPGTFLAPTVPSFTQGGVTIDGTGSANDAVSFYDNTILVSPSSSSTVFVGGVGLYRSTDHGHTWTFLPASGGVHTDQHALAFDPATGLILEGTDGGLFDFDPTTSTPTFTSFNALISASQVQGISAHPTDPTKLVAGFQDNGTQVYSGMVNTWFGADSENGDGGVELYDQIDPTHIYHDFSDDNNGNPGISVSTNGGSTWCSEPGAAPCNVVDSEWTPNLITQLNTNGDTPTTGGGSLFYPPLAVDPAVAYRVLFAAHGVYVSTDAMAHWAVQTTQDLTSPTCFMAFDPTSCAVDDIEFAPSDHTKAWTVAASSPDGSVPFAVNNTTQANIQVDGTHANGGLWTDVTAHLNAVFTVANTQATGIAVDPHNANVAYLTLSGFTSGANIGTGVGHIYKTTDFGTTWVEADGSTGNGSVPGANPLPDVPVLRVLVDATDSSGTCGGNPCSNSIFAGTDLGMFHSSDGGQDWFPYNLGVIPMVPVYDLSQDTLGNVYAGTHGRGVFALNVLSATATPTATATATANHQPRPQPRPRDGHPNRNGYRDKDGHRHGDSDCNRLGNNNRDKDLHCNRDRYPDSDRDPHRNGDGYDNSDSYDNSDRHDNPDGDSYCDGYGNSDFISDINCNSDSYRDCDRHKHPEFDSLGYGNSDFISDFNRNSDSYRDCHRHPERHGNSDSNRVWDRDRNSDRLDDCNCDADGDRHSDCHRNCNSHCVCDRNCNCDSDRHCNLNFDDRRHSYPHRDANTGSCEPEYSQNAGLRLSQSRRVEDETLEHFES